MKQRLCGPSKKFGSHVSSLCSWSADPAKRLENAARDMAFADFMQELSHGDGAIAVSSEDREWLGLLV